MPAPLQYLNKELHAAAGRRNLHEPRKPDLQRLTREARIQARKRSYHPAGQTSMDTMGWLQEGVDLSLRAVRSCLAQTVQFTRQRPLQVAAGAVIAGIAVGLLMRRR